MARRQDAERLDLRELARSQNTAVAGSVAAVWVGVDALIPWANNPRFNDPEHVAQVAESIKRFGWGAPVIVNARDGTLAAGHSRILAARFLSMQTVPARFLDLDPEEAELLALADNRLTETGRWDDKALAAILVKHRDRDAAALRVAGFEDSVVTAHLRRAARDDAASRSSDEDPGPDISRAAQLQQEYGTALGQVWRIAGKVGTHRLIVGDCTDEAVAKRLFGAERAACCWTDPPYGVAYRGVSTVREPIQNDNLSEKDFRALLIGCFRAATGHCLTLGAAAYVAHPPGPRALDFVHAFGVVEWTIRQTLIWVKDTFVVGHQDYHSAHEPIFLVYTPGATGRRGRGGDGWYGDNAQSTVFQVPRPRRSEEHPTMKPVDLIRPMISNSSPPGGLVYDPFMGSGSTMVAAELSGRRAYGCELAPEYAAVVLHRMVGLGCTVSREDA